MGFRKIAVCDGCGAEREVDGTIPSNWVRMSTLDDQIVCSVPCARTLYQADLELKLRRLEVGGLPTTKDGAA